MTERNGSPEGVFSVDPRSLLSHEIDLTPIRGKAAALWRKVEAHPMGTIVWLGAALRVWVYLGNRPYWMDEGSLLGNLRGKSILDFSTHLTGDQLAPPAFLVAERLLIALMGDSGHVTRLIPLCCGLASLWLFRSLATRLLRPGPALLAVLLASFSDDLIYYSSELKPYSCDMAIGLIVTLLSLDLLDRSLAGRRLIESLALAPVCPWASFPSVFVIAGCGATLLLNRLRSWRWGEVGWLGLIATLWVTSLFAAVRFARSLLGPATTMYVFWAFAFLPVPPRSTDDLARLLGNLAEIFVNPLNLATPWIPAMTSAAFILLTIAGFVSLARRSPWATAALGLPILLGTAASASNTYPLHGRLMLELVPAFLVFIAEGTGLLRTWLGRRALAIVLVILLAYPCLVPWWNATGVRNRDFNPHGDLHHNIFIE